MAHRRIPGPLVAALAVAAVVAAAASPAVGAANGGPGKPTAQSVFDKHIAAANSNSAGAEGPGDDQGDEAETVKLRGEFQQSITAAPAVSAPTAGLVAATRAAAGLPTYAGTWHETTGKPFVNDPIDRGANYGVGWNDVTGRMTALTHSGHTVYAAAASGGVWRSTDEGIHWIPVDAGLPRLSIGALATDPSDGSVWAGTGEANNASENQYGVGVYRLARGSSTWRQVGGSELYGSGSYRITWIHGHVYVATSHGLYRRAVGAAAASPWRSVLQPTGNVSYPPSSSVTDVVAVPGNRRQVLAVVGWAGYSSPAATTDNGFYVGSGRPGSFVKVTPTGDIDPTRIGRTSFSSSHGWLYAIVQDTATDDLGVEGAFVSRSGSPTGPWTRIADTNQLAGSGSALGDYSSGYYPGIQSDYNQVITADPADPKHVYLQLEEVYESTNAGRTWTTVGPYWNYDISCEQYAGDPYACPPTTHPDQHAGMIYNGQFWAGNDGGVWRRPLSARGRGSWTNLNATLHTTQNYSIAVGRSGNGLAYWGGLQDNGESYTTTSMPDVEQAFTGDGGDTIVDPHNGNRAVLEYVDLDMYLTTDASVATLKEISPSCLTATDPPAVCDPNPRFIAPIAMDVNNPTHWLAGGQYVWNDTRGWNTVCSGAEGCDWKKVYDTGSGHQVTALAANGATKYAAWCGGCNPPTFARGMATNYGGTWHELSLTGVPNRYITSIAVDPANAAHVYLSVGSYSRRWIADAGYGHVFESTDGGGTWSNVTGTLPDAPVFTLALVGSHLVAGTEVGAFIADTGAGALSWATLGSGLPNVTVWDVTTTPQGRVVVGTHGRGDWQIRLRQS